MVGDICNFHTELAGAKLKRNAQGPERLAQVCWSRLDGIAVVGRRRSS